MGQYKYRLPEPMIYKTGSRPHRWPGQALELSFGDGQRTWLTLKRDGTIEVQAGYAWDGCSPKLALADVIWIGTPDGVVVETGLPKTYRASLLHDALCQFAQCSRMPYSQAEIDRIFFDVLQQDGFQLARLYYGAVRLFGGVYRRLKRNNGQFS